MRAVDAKVAQRVNPRSLFHQKVCGNEKRRHRQKPHTHGATDFEDRCVCDHILGNGCEMRLFHFCLQGEEKIFHKASDLKTFFSA